MQIFLTLASTLLIFVGGVSASNAAHLHDNNDDRWFGQSCICVICVVVGVCFLFSVIEGRFE